MEGSYFQIAKDCINDFKSSLVIVWAIDVDDVICEGCNWGACRRVQTNWLVCFDRVIAISSYLTFLWAFYRASTVLLMQCTSKFNQKLKFTEVYVSFQKFFCFVFFCFDMNHNRRDRLPKQKWSMSSKEKKDNASIRGEYGRYIKELFRNGGIIMGFIGVRICVFNHWSLNYHQRLLMMWGNCELKLVPVWASS